jgi:hypothetical protein
MQRNTAALVAEVDRDVELFGLGSSVRTGAAVPEPRLDVDRAVVVALTSGDGLICLDYRDDPERPRVVVSDWTAGPVRWRVVARDVEEVVARIG